MNDKAYELILKILASDLPKEDKSEIVRFWMLPRNTPVKPKIEQEEASGDVGPVSQPSKHDIDRKNNPVMAGEEDAMTNTLKGVVEGTEK